MKPSFAKKTKILLWVIAVVIVLSAAAFCFFFIMGTSKDDYAREDSPSIAIHPAGEKYSERTTGKHARLSLEDRLVAELKEFYGKNITEKSTQVLLLRLKNFLSGLYPEDGDLRFYAILKRAFPDLADEIMETLEKMERYAAWLEENESMLSELNNLEKQGLLWEKRRAFFGDVAEDIWSEEMLAYKQRKQDMKETLRMLDDAHDTTLDEKLFMYKDSLNQTYGESPEAYILEQTDMLAKVFFSIDSVQKELAQLDPEQRKLEIARIRKEMGYTAGQIDELSAMDDYRNRRWENGLAYMEERDRLATEYTGAPLDEQLKALREKYFKHEAKTIELEEKDGFFRYKRNRYYGRN